MKLSIYSYNQQSEGAKALALELGVKQIAHKNSKFKGHPDKTVINWGATKLPEEVVLCDVINGDISCAVDKLSFFKALEGSGFTPEYTTEKSKALEWLAEGDIVARTILNGHSAEGLVIINPNKTQDFVDAPLYTMYKKKKHEFRVHVVGGNVIDVQRKAKKKDFEGEVNYQVRNLANGFIYAREGFETPECVKTCATKVIKMLNLDFGAVDIIYNEGKGIALALEINTAPGLQGSTVKLYADALRTL